jgi:uncharacterized protein (DUF885 family)
MDPDRVARYNERATECAAWLDRELEAIRRNYDAGLITIRQAADERIRRMEQHLATIRNLRDEYLGPGPDG